MYMSCCTCTSLFPVGFAALQGHRGAVSSVTFNAAGTLLATGSFDGIARTWDLSTGQCRVMLKVRKRILATSRAPLQNPREADAQKPGVRLLSCSRASVVAHSHQLRSTNECVC